MSLADRVAEGVNSTLVTYTLILHKKNRLLLAGTGRELRQRINMKQDFFIITGKLAILRALTHISGE